MTSKSSSISSKASSIAKTTSPMAYAAKAEASTITAAGLLISSLLLSLLVLISSDSSGPVGHDWTAVGADQRAVAVAEEAAVTVNRPSQAIACTAEDCAAVERAAGVDVVGGPGDEAGRGVISAASLLLLLSQVHVGGLRLRGLRHLLVVCGALLLLVVDADEPLLHSLPRQPAVGHLHSLHNK